MSGSLVFLSKSPMVSATELDNTPSITAVTPSATEEMEQQLTPPSEFENYDKKEAAERQESSLVNETISSEEKKLHSVPNESMEANFVHSTEPAQPIIINNSTQEIGNGLEEQKASEEISSQLTSVSSTDIDIKSTIETSPVEKKQVEAKLSNETIHQQEIASVTEKNNQESIWNFLDTSSNIKKFPAVPSEKPANSAMPRPENEGQIMEEGSFFRNSDADLAAFNKFKEQLQEIDVEDRIETLRAQSGLNNNEKQTILDLFVKKNSDVLGAPVGKNTYEYKLDGTVYHAWFQVGPRGRVIVRFSKFPSNEIIVAQNTSAGSVVDPLKTNYSLTEIKKVVPQLEQVGDLTGKSPDSIAVYQEAKLDAENQKVIVNDEINRSSKDQLTINKKEAMAKAAVGKLED